MTLNKKFQPLLYDAIIIGAGPAGLMAGLQLRQSNRNILILDRGKEVDKRERNDSFDIASGVGGAGLYSDGKFSYFPSATRLWELPSTEDLQKSYKAFCNLLEPFSIHPPNFFVSNNTNKSESFLSSNYFVSPKNGRKPFQKLYRSDFLSFSDRMSMIKQISEKIGSQNFKLNCEIVGCIFNSDSSISLKIKTNEKNSCEKEEVLRSRSLIYCGGRFGPLNLSKIFGELPTVFRRYEAGIRIETPSENFPLYKNQQEDVKIIINLADSQDFFSDDESEYIEVRTFCACRDGEVVQVFSDGITSYSGRADLDKTQKTNIAVNLRLQERNSQSSLAREFAHLLDKPPQPFSCNLKSFLSSEFTYLGPQIDEYLRKSLPVIIPGIQEVKDCVIYGPTIEGVGFYPQLDPNLKIINCPIWVAGDATGLFRGLTAALISGDYVARKVNDYLSITADSPLESSFLKLKIKISSTDNMKAVYTAQSKTHFYCRDTICQFVMQKGWLPLNPFRVFDYFLGDRVNRDVVRKGNNHLVRMCDELWVFGPISDGVLFEIAYAKRLGKPVHFFSIATRADEIHPLSIEEIIFEPEVHAKQITKKELISFIWEGNEPIVQSQLPLLEIAKDTE